MDHLIESTSLELSCLPKKCVVCEKQGHGNHYGVFTCRACAAFFKRCLDRTKDYKCRSEKEIVCRHFNCKFCRLKKCKARGMTVENELTPTEEVVCGERALYLVRHPRTKKPVQMVNLKPIVRRSQMVLDAFDLPQTPEFQRLSSLRKMASALERMRSSQSFEPTIVSTMSIEDHFSSWEGYMVNAAEWLMHSTEFRKLPGHEKFEFFKLTWAVWRRFDRMTMSAQVFGRRSHEQKMYLIADDVAANWDTFQLDSARYWKTQGKDYQSLLRQNLGQYFEGVVKPCVEWEFSVTELSFALAQIVWNYAGRKLLGQTQAAGETFLEEISDDLHEHYTKERKIPNYAARLAVLMEMVNFVLRTQKEHEKRMEMVMLFEMVNVVLTDPHFFNF